MLHERFCEHFCLNTERDILDEQNYKYKRRLYRANEMFLILLLLKDKFLFNKLVFKKY